MRKNILCAIVILVCVQAIPLAMSNLLNDNTPLALRILNIFLILLMLPGFINAIAHLSSKEEEKETKL